MVFENEYKEKSFREMASIPKISILKDEYGIDTDSIKDKPTRLALYNKVRRSAGKRTHGIERKKRQKAECLYAGVC